VEAKNDLYWWFLVAGKNVFREKINILLQKDNRKKFTLNFSL